MAAHGVVISGGVLRAATNRRRRRARVLWAAPALSRPGTGRAFSDAGGPACVGDWRQTRLGAHQHTRSPIRAAELSQARLPCFQDGELLDRRVTGLKSVSRA